ncbi:MAG: hypothetical protein U5K33_04770 [Halofilum sp. (in: g-proteobacteria)]|nr:hypothetical protein [Halofilum sp. (in: g-proteobacteria)]
MPEQGHCSRELVLHVGFPKTATTLLQRGLFCRDPRVVYLGKRASTERANRASAELVRRLLWSSGECWRNPRDQLVTELSNAVESPGSGPLLISYEELTGSCFGALRVCNRFGNGRQIGVDPAALADRIGVFAREAWHGPVRVLFTVRRQDTFLASLFAQTFLWRHATHINSFDRFLRSVCDTDFYSAGGLALDYAWLAAEFERAIGTDAVSVLVYEDMVGDPSHFARELKDSLGIAPSTTCEALSDAGWKVRSTDRLSWQVQRYRGNNRVRHAFQWAQRRLSGTPNPERVVLTPERSRAILDGYADSNRRLGHRLGRSLEAYGYY